MPDQTHWRLAVMLDGIGRLDELAHSLSQAGAAIRDAAAGHPVRLGVAISDFASPASIEQSHDMTGWRTVDAAVEITIPNDREGEAVAICRTLRPVLEPIARPGGVETMIGRMYRMVPVRPGSMFLSLAFRRYPGTSVDQFRSWWRDQHGPLATSVIPPQHLLAYDQVHVAADLSREAATALGVADAGYDAYDNLTYADRDGFAASCSDGEGMERIAQDETGRIDDGSRRYALMREIG